MVTNYADHRGFITVGPVDGAVQNIISGNATFTHAPSMPGKYEAYQSTGSQTLSGSAVHWIIQCNGSAARANGGQNLWSTSSHKFTPTVAGKVYMMRVDFILSASSGTPFFHMDLEYGGRIPTGSASHHSSASIQRQSVETAVVKGQAFDHSHFHANFLFFSDADMLVSGVQLYGAVDTAQSVTLKSASIMIAEH